MVLAIVWFVGNKMKCLPKQIKGNSETFRPASLKLAKFHQSKDHTQNPLKI